MGQYNVLKKTKSFCSVVSALGSKKWLHGTAFRLHITAFWRSPEVCHVDVFILEQFFFLKIWSGFFFLQLSGSAHFIVITTITNTMQCGNRRILLIVQFFLFYDTFITIFPIYFFLSIPNFALPERCDCLLCQSILHKIINWYIIIFCRKIVLLPARRGLIFCHDISSFWIEISLFFCFFLTTKF